MKTSIIGYPRIGEARELKFSLEHYFKGKLTETELFETARRLRYTHWKKQQDFHIAYPCSNDFSFYDNMLDTAYLFHIIPNRYQTLKLSVLDTYFAMARGYQGTHGDVKALAMKKWFNTNYHYMVPEFEDTTNISLFGTKPFDEYIEAKKASIETKPTLIGPFTFLKLARFTGSKTAVDFANDLANAYIELIDKFVSIGATWLQLDEPSLVMDLTKEDLDLFDLLYRKITAHKGSLKLLLQTYFGDVRDCYSNIISLGFDAIGLDFIEGTQTLSLINSFGFPKHCILFAGVVNGKNIWRNHYEKTLSLVAKLTSFCDEIVLNTSCSLLHVPYTLRNEHELSDQYTKYFSFAEEKLEELLQLMEITASSHPDTLVCFQNNKALFKTEREATNQDVKQRVKHLKETDFTRLPAFSKRQTIQTECFKLPLLPTTSIGSFPQITEVRKQRSRYRNGELSEREYLQFLKDKISSCVALQEEIGLDVLVHGEFERTDMVEYFGECLDGYLFTKKAWVQSYGTRCVKPPVIWGDISRKKPMTVFWSTYAQSLTPKPMKGMLTGPVTILNWSFPREDISLEECAYQIGLAIRDEVLDLEANGISIIQVDEAALREKLPLRKDDWTSKYLDWAIKAFRLVHSGVKPETQIHTHMCYSEFADIIDDIDAMDADVITFEASRSDLTLLEALQQHNFQTAVGPGVYDIHSPRIPSIIEIQNAIEKMLSKISQEKLWINPDCGLKTREEAETIPSLKNLVQAAKQCRKNL